MMHRGVCDSHAHLTSSDIFEQVDAVLERAQAAGVITIVNICTDALSLENGFVLSKRYPWVYQAVAVHPHDAEKEGETFFPVVAEYARKGDIVAIGETGLDYHYHHSTPEIQQHFLREHLKLALKCKLPVIIHCREAFSDFFKIIDADYMVNNRHAPGVLHCFTGTLADAHQVLDRGWYISISGIATFKKSTELREVAKIVPLDRLLIETDAPYLAPQSKRGRPNEPAYIVETAEVVAAVKGISLEQLIQVTSQNAHCLFGLETIN